MTETIFTHDYQSTPYWWQRTPRPSQCGDAPPQSADVVVIGSGYTGLSAAIQTARGGRRTVVVDSEAAGWGCSSRNGGQVSPSIKPPYHLLAKRLGAPAATRILREGNNALAWIEAFIADHDIACDYRKVGRFHGAHSPAAFAQLRRAIAALPSELGIDAYPLARTDQHSEVASDLYHGGVIYPHHACIDPARYHRGLLECAQAAGCEIISHCRVDSIQRRGGTTFSGGARHDNTERDGASRGSAIRNTTRNNLEVRTTKGSIVARDVIVATSGYTGGITPWQRRRIIPVGTYVIATEPLPSGTLERLLPRNRVVTDTRRMVMYYRACPERRRLLFGGRVCLRETDPRRSAPRLRRQMLRLFPELEAARISHSWMGFVGFTFDQLPHSGARDGLHYSLGYCGSGISLSSYLGMKTGLKVLGDPGGATALDPLRFPARPYYRRTPWFLAPALLYYRWRDEMESARAGRRCIRAD
ncbi:MAG: NAD(P)/FAD-dependent oxidoreductase [bacterium]